jgi:C4-dicarboxylate transporter, DctM subunit
MELQVLVIIGIVVSIVLVLIGVPVAFSLLLPSVIALLFGIGPLALGKLGTTPFAAFYSLAWTALPLFVLMSLIIGQTSIAADIFNAANKWLSRLRGGLVVAAIVAEAIMASAIGSSTICILSVGKVALPQMERANYNRKFALGALLSAGLLGPLIPPSIPLIVYGALTQTSISKLLIAGVLPGIVLTIMLSLYAIIACRIKPGLAPASGSVKWGARFSSLKSVWPILVILVGIIGSIYAGIATATEAAGVGVVLALLVAVTAFKFRWHNLIAAMKETATSVGMIGVMVIAATVFTFAVGSSGIAKSIANWILHLGLNPYGVIVAINIFILVLGCIMDTLAIVLVTVPILVPIILALGFDPVWFGIVIVVNTEIGLITPPIGLNTFITGQIFKEPIANVLKGVAPFFLVEIVFLALIIAVPEISLILPNAMK